jgi:hypothetical protein
MNAQSTKNIGSPSQDIDTQRALSLKKGHLFKRELLAECVTSRQERPDIGLLCECEALAELKFCCLGENFMEPRYNEKIPLSNGTTGGIKTMGTHKRSENGRFRRPLHSHSFIHSLSIARTNLESQQTKEFPPIDKYRSVITISLLQCSITSESRACVYWQQIR